MPDKGFVEKRAHPRVKADLLINLIFKNNYITTYSRNISEQGLFIETYELPEVNTNINLKFKLPGVKKEINAIAKVIWVKDEPDKGIGVKIEKMDNFDKIVIKEFIRRQLKFSR